MKYDFMKINRVLNLNCLRLVLLCLILWHYFGNIACLFNYFQNELKPRVQNCFLLATPGAATGECYAVDFLHFYAAGLLNRERIEKKFHADVYNAVLLTQTTERIISPMHPLGTEYFRYPPILFALITPLAYFNLATAWGIWFFILGTAVVLTYLVIAYHLLKDRPLLLFGLFVSLTAFPVIQNFFIGQTTAIEAAMIALAFRFLIDKKYFSSGIFAALALFKPQQALIILIPGLFVGKKDFLCGLGFMTGIQIILSAFLVGIDNVLHFIRSIYLVEITHAIRDVDEPWYYFTFTGVLAGMPWFISNAVKIGQLSFALMCIIISGLWFKIYPILQKISNQSIELLASITVIAVVVFNLHGLWYDYLLLIFPCFWIYIWSTTADTGYTTPQALMRLAISVICFWIPFSFWDSLVMKFSESTIAWYQMRYFLTSMLLLACALTALYLEFKKRQNKVLLG